MEYIFIFHSIKGEISPPVVLSGGSGPPPPPCGNPVVIGGKCMTKMTLGLQNHWGMANSGIGIVPRDLHWRESVQTLYLAEGGIGILAGSITAGEHYRFSGSASLLALPVLMCDPN